MLETGLTALIWFAGIGCTLMGGLYFAFSAFIMTALGRIAPAAGMGAMQSINDVIVRSIFLPLFFATSLVSLMAVGLGAVWWDRPGSAWVLTAGATYFVGMFLCTVVFNVPLNERLKAADPASPEGVAVWRAYGRVWTRWNHVRTVASILAGVLFLLSL